MGLISKIKAKLSRRKNQPLSADEFTEEQAKKQWIYSNYLRNGKLKLVSYIGKDEDVVVPRIIDGKVVSALDQFAFRGACHVESITLPYTIIEIGASAFEGCINLKKINIPKGVKIINCYLFKDCRNLQHVELPEYVEYITLGIFSNSGVSSLHLPKNARIGHRAFKHMPCLSEITVAEGNPYVKLIDGALYSVSPHDDSLALVVVPAAGKAEQLIIPEGVTVIIDKPFLDNSYIKKIVCPESMQDIGCAFHDIAQLELLVIPHSVNLRADQIYLSNGSCSFDGCDNLRLISVHSCITDWCWEAGEWMFVPEFDRRRLYDYEFGDYHVRRCALRGFVYGIYNGYTFDEDVSSANRDYISSHIKSLHNLTLEDVYLQRYLMDEGLLSLSMCDELMEMAKGSTEKTAQLLQYRKNCFPDSFGGAEYNI